jgi:hypothetical protein
LFCCPSVWVCFFPFFSLVTCDLSISNYLNKTSKSWQKLYTFLAKPISLFKKKLIFLVKLIFSSKPFFSMIKSLSLDNASIFLAKLLTLEKTCIFSLLNLYLLAHSLFLPS